MNNSTVLHGSLTLKLVKNVKVRFYYRKTPAEYTLNLVRKHDYESFVCTLLLPSELRSTAFAIRAFNTEVSLVRDQVEDNKIGLMRIKFWEDALNRVYDNDPPHNPTCMELSRILQNNKLSKHYFKRLIEARFNQLNESRFLNVESVEKYAEQTVSSIYYLLLEAYGIKDLHTDHFASHFGKAQGIVNLIRSIPYNAEKRYIVIPQDILRKYRLSTESLFQKRTDKNIKDAIFEITCLAKLHLDKAFSMQEKIRQKSKIIFLSQFIIKTHLKTLEKIDFDVFDPSLRKRDNLLPFKLYFKRFFM